MFWDDENDSESWQMFKNFAFLKLPVTNKDRDEAFSGSSLGIALVIILIIFALIAIFA